MSTEPHTTPPRPFAIVACQRSGTHMLREILNSNPHVAIVAEALSRDGGPTTWHYFLESLPPRKLLPASDAEATELFDQYIDAVHHDFAEHGEWFGGAKEPPTSPGLDVKYNQIKSINPLYTDLRLRPFLLDYFAKRQYRIVHLVRENILHQAISLVMATQRNVWRNYDGGKLQGSFRISIDELIAYMQWVRAERAEFERLSQGLDIRTCTYQSVVDEIERIDGEGRFRENLNSLSILAEFLEVPNRFHYNQCLPKVLNRPYSEFIENHAEVIAAVKNSEFSHFADTI